MHERTEGQERYSSTAAFDGKVNSACVPAGFLLLLVYGMMG